MTKQTVNTSLWDRFLAEKRGKQPTVEKDVLPNPLSDKELLASIDRAVRAGLKFNGGPTLCLYADDREVFGPQSPHFIPETDDIDTYAADLQRKLNCETFCVIAGSFMLFCPTIWERLAPIDHYLLSKLGVPAGHMDCTLFFGNYQITPFAIHRDPHVDVVAFGIKGEKRMAVWSQDYFEHCDDLRKMRLHNGTTAILESPDPFMKDARYLEFGPGDMAYWPQSFWHTGSQPRSGMLTATISLVYDQKSAFSRLMSQVVASMVQQGMGESDNLARYWDRLDANTLPEEVAQVVDHLEQAFGAGHFRAIVQDSWRKLASSKSSMSAK